MRPKRVAAAPGRPGLRVNGPPMLSPRQIDGVLQTAARRRGPAPLHAPPVVPTTVIRRGPSAPAIRPGTRAAQSLPSDPGASGTGINPWWRYQEQSEPGGGRVMVNVGTGNMLLQDDDMLVPHKGIAMAFRRTYNSQSLHDVNADDATPFLYKAPGMYGNGWTNTFDASIARTATGPTSATFTVFDIDGARYDYTNPVGTATPVYIPGPGNHNTLTFDGQCGLLWTKKSGTTYYFYRPNPAPGCGPPLGDGSPTGGYAGRLYQIIGRNRNTHITFSYTWDNGDASQNGKIRTITATTESGMATTLTFGDVNGHRLLQQLTYPDGVTTVFYGYDDQGNLTWVSQPENNSSGTRRMQSYGYQTLRTGSVMTWAASPRYYAGCNGAGGCGSDGALLEFSYSGTSVASSTLSQIWHYGVVNPSDGVNGPIQSGYSTTAFWYLGEYYTTGTSTSTYRDTDGHYTNWVVDGLGRPTQTQECTQTTYQAAQCVQGAAVLSTNEAWDADNNLTSVVDPRGYETDYAYDANGNAIAVAQPQTTTSQGTFRPTALYSYDSYNNVTAYCDPVETHRLQKDWTTAPTGDALCPASDILATRFIWSTDPTQSGTASASPSYEPYGQLLSRIGPQTEFAQGGYRVNYAYDPSRQGGTDFGLPTSVTAAAAFSQIDGTTRQPAQSFWYDTNGNLGCYSKGNGTWTLRYDALGRMTVVADPDDSSQNAGSICGKTTGTAGWNTSTTYAYYPDGSKASAQIPSERAFNVANTWTYDVDGNALTETTHHGCVPNQTCPAGTTQKWYDGADRLVEVAQPADPRTWGGVPNTYSPGVTYTRYLYDLSAGNTVTVGTSGPFHAYGNLYETAGVAGPSTLLERSGTAYDALDRAVTKYSWNVPTSTLYSGTLQATQMQYDATAATLGLLAMRTNPAGETTSYTYDELGRIAQQVYGSDGGRTPAETYSYDPDGRAASITSSQFGTQQYVYYADGLLKTSIEPNGGGLTDPAQLQYWYYPDGKRAALSVQSPTFNQTNAMAYSYRPDGLTQTQTINAFTTGSWSRTYTDAGRLSAAGGVDSRAIAYDSTGQVQTDTMHGNPITYSHDPEGSPLTETVPNLPPVSYTYNVRGELIDTLGLSDHYRTQYGDSDGGCGSRIVMPVDNSYIPNQNPPTPLMDARSCAFISRTSGGTDWYNGQSYDDTTSTTASYDNAGRVIHTADRVARFQEPQSSGTGDDMGAEATPAATVAPYPYSGDASYPAQVAKELLPSSQVFGARSATTPGYDITTTTTADTQYDAENHTVSRTGTTVRTVIPLNSPSGKTTTSVPQTCTLGWGPNGHPILAVMGSSSSVSMTLHWDGDVILFATDANGAVVDFKAGLDGEVTPSDANWPGLAVFNRDHSGTIVDTASNGKNYFFPFDAQDGGSPFGTSGFIPQYVPYARSDGFTIYNVQISGVRAYDPALQMWTTPDAYEGEVHDPTSQMKYMWNRNNPMDYSDPTGYDAWIGFEADNIFTEHAMVVIRQQDGSAVRYSWGPKTPSTNSSDRSSHVSMASSRSSSSNSSDSSSGGYRGDGKMDVNHGSVKGLMDPEYMWASLHLTDKESAALQKQLDAYRANHHQFDVIQNNCDDVIYRALIAAGITKYEWKLYGVPYIDARVLGAKKPPQ